MRARSTIALSAVALMLLLVTFSSAQPTVPTWSNPTTWGSNVGWARTQYEGGDLRCWIAWFPRSTALWAIVWYEQGTEAILSGGTELLTNGDFRKGTQEWQLNLHHGAVARWQVIQDSGPTESTPALQVNVEQIGTQQRGEEWWSAQVRQKSLGIRQRQWYRLSFWAKSAQPSTPITWVVQQAIEPWRIHVWGPGATLNVTQRWQQYTLTAPAFVTDPNVQLVLNAGYAATTLWIAGISLQEIAEESPAFPGKPVIGMQLFSWYYPEQNQGGIVGIYFRPMPDGHYAFIERTSRLVPLHKPGKYPLFDLTKESGRLFLDFALSCGAKEEVVRDPVLEMGRSKVMPFLLTKPLEHRWPREVWFPGMVDVPTPPGYR